MEERRLNFDAPLLSVRRFSRTSSLKDRNKQTKVENSNPVTQNTLPWSCSDASPDQVTEPVAVPFVWERIPGKAKGGAEHEPEPEKEASATPRLPPGRISKCPVEEECVNHQGLVRTQTETCDVNDNVSRLDCLNNEKCDSESDNGDDVYSDALDTLSPTDSYSMNCSTTGLSASDGLAAKPSETFSRDRQTQDFMLRRFLPAARAMTLETPKYASRKQSVAPEQPREVKKVVVGDRKSPVDRYESAIVPYCHQDVDEEETEDDEYDDEDDNDYRDSGNLSRKACGLLPRLCFKSSLGLLNPVPGLKLRAHSSMPTSESVKPRKATCSKSRSHIVEKNAWDVVPKNKSDKGVQSTVLSGNKSDGLVQSPRLSRKKSDRGVLFSGPLVNRSGSAFQSPRLSGDKLDRGLQSPRLLVNRSDSAFQSPRLSKDKPATAIQPHRLAEIGKELICVSNDQQMVNRSPPKGSGRISPYRRERPQSPFRGGGFLGLPKEAEKYKANMMVKYTRSNNNSRELVPYPSTRQGSDSPSPAVERTLYVDTVNFADISSSNSSDTKVLESSLRDIKGFNILDGQGLSEYEIAGSVKSGRSSFCDKPDPRQNGGLDHLFKSLEQIKVRADGNMSHTDDDDDSKAADSDYSPLPLPLPKTPSESWLCRAVPSRKSSVQSNNGTRFKPKKQEPEAPAADAKWETIVKTSYLHHDHVRYSEELITPFTQQSKT